MATLGKVSWVKVLPPPLSTLGQTLLKTKVWCGIFWEAKVKSGIFEIFPGERTMRVKTQVGNWKIQQEENRPAPQLGRKLSCLVDHSYRNVVSPPDLGFVSICP